MAASYLYMLWSINAYCNTIVVLHNYNASITTKMLIDNLSQLPKCKQGSGYRRTVLTLFHPVFNSQLLAITLARHDKVKDNSVINRYERYYLRTLDKLQPHHLLCEIHKNQ